MRILLVAGYIFSLITPLDEQTGAVVAALLITFLALSGGLKSVAWTDFLSAILIVFALWVALFLVVGVDVGGLSPLAEVNGHPTACHHPALVLEGTPS